MTNYKFKTLNRYKIRKRFLVILPVVYVIVDVAFKNHNKNGVVYRVRFLNKRDFYHI